MSKPDDKTEWLESYFDAARRQSSVPSDDLLKRVAGDAERVQAAWAAPVMPASPSRPGRWRQFYRVLGGWPAVAGLGTAAVAGIWLGISPPMALDAVAQDYLGGENLIYLVDISADGAFGLDGGAL